MNVSIVFPLSPAAGIGLFCLTILGLHWWLLVTIGILSIYLAQVTEPMSSSIVVGIPESLGVIIGAFFLRKRNFDPRFERVADVVLFFSAAGVSSLVAGLTAGAILGGLTGLRQEQVWADVIAVSATTLTGVLVVAPACFLWLAAPARAKDTQWWLNFGVTVVGALLTSWIVFEGPSTRLVRAYLIIPALVWGALTTGVQGSSVVLILVAVVGGAFTAFGEGPLTYTGTLQFAPLQQFLCVTAITT